MTGENKMRFAIVESGGKQYRAIEGRTIEVDRLPVETGNKFDFERVLLMADGDDVMVGTPLISEILVKVTVVDHVKGPKIDRFKYRPKKRIRVRGGHRQQYTRLLVDFIGRPDEDRDRRTEEAAPAPVAVVEVPQEEKQPRAKKAAAKPATKKSPSKKTDASKKQK
jgi:large subunit ribosomal protein L21